jgi:hypothetical protein
LVSQNALISWIMGLCRFSSSSDSGASSDELDASAESLSEFGAFVDSSSEFEASVDSSGLKIVKLKLKSEFIYTTTPSSRFSSSHADSSESKSSLSCMFWGGCSTGCGGATKS